ncbi:helix-turn-helix transcriptional regulator [Berryella wangjianweii]|uniref:helix-turn-helix transcriptional regulator n=1 Tax=Berryella wangjianweii TaxID=2734634 RepID=UPI0021BDD1C7|nr:helix-turn-helix transcriptional regulator [Berryella wangjianweii]
MRAYASVLRPSVAILGYALFLAINAASVWGGVFPFIPLSLQTPSMLLWFSLAYSGVFLMCYAASGVGAYFMPGPTNRFIVGLASAPYLLGWCLIIAGMYLPRLQLPLSVAGGAALGLGSAGFYMLWQRLFASQDADEANRTLIVGTLYAAPLYLSLYLIPQSLTAFLVPFVFLPLFGLAVALTSRTIDRDQAIFQDVPRHHPQLYRRAVTMNWRSALCMGAIGLCAGLMRALAIDDPSIGPVVNVLSMVGSLTTAGLLMAAWQVTGVRLSFSRFYHLAFPLVITAFALLAVLGPSYQLMLAALLYALFSAVVMLMMMQSAQISRDQGINPIFIYAVYGGIVYALHELGFAGGMLAQQTGAAGIAPAEAIALFGVYLLAFMYFLERDGLMPGQRRNGGNDGDYAGSRVELVALRSRAKRPAAAAAAASSSASLTCLDAAGAGPTVARMQDAKGARTASAADARASRGGVTGGSSAGPVGEPSGGIADSLGGSLPADLAGNLAADRHAAPGESPLDAAAEAGTTNPSAHPLTPDQPRVVKTDAPSRIAREGADAKAADAEEAAPERITLQVQALAARYRLTSRETEVTELVARGHTVARIAQMLFVSENTVKTHSKRIYAKLGIHRRQDLLDLLGQQR